VTPSTEVYAAPPRLPWRFMVRWAAVAILTAMAAVICAWAKGEWGM